MLVLMKQCSCPSSAFSVNSLSLLCRENSCIHYIESTDRGELHNLSKPLPISACYFRIPCAVVGDFFFFNVMDYIKTTCIIFRERWYAVSSTDCTEKKMGFSMFYKDFLYDLSLEIVKWEYFVNFNSKLNYFSIWTFKSITEDCMYFNAYVL